MAEPSLPPYNVGDLDPGAARRMAPAVARNREPIAAVLERWLPKSGLVLEIASGTGEHARVFAERFANLEWRPSDPDPEALASIVAWSEGGPANLRPPMRLDASAADWPVERAAAILGINMVHISPWQSALGLLDGAARLLSPGAPLILYGPWLVEGETPAPSNLAFDTSLRERDPRWGLRQFGDFRREAEDRGLVYADRVDMPANNLMLRFDRA